MARRYPLAMLWNEARYARRRVNQKACLDAVVMHTTIASVLAGGNHLKRLLKDLTNAD